MKPYAAAVSVDMRFYTVNKALWTETGIPKEIKCKDQRLHCGARCLMLPDELARAVYTVRPLYSH